GQGEEAGTELWQFQYDGLSYGRPRVGLGAPGDKAVWVEGDRKSHIAGPVGARGLEELGMEDDDEEASSRDRKSGAVGDDTEDDREENWAGSVVNSGRGDLSRVTDRLKPDSSSELATLATAQQADEDPIQPGRRGSTQQSTNSKDSPA
ncbi:hypothetical protein THAOC_29412, partial [Thalassiosira oceanica]